MNCLKCNYKLVLLSNRRQYKCALCSNLYPQKYIENRECQKLNELQKIQDVSNLNLQRKQKLNQIRDIKKALKHLFNGKPESYSKEYINQKSREWRAKHREQDLKRKREYNQRNKEVVNLRCRIRNYRVRQGQLALELSEDLDSPITIPSLC